MFHQFLFKNSWYYCLLTWFYRHLYHELKHALGFWDLLAWWLELCYLKPISHIISLNLCSDPLVGKFLSISFIWVLSLGKTDEYFEFSWIERVGSKNFVFSLKILDLSKILVVLFFNVESSSYVKNLFKTLSLFLV